MKARGKPAPGTREARPRHLVAEADPVRFLDAFFELLMQPVDIILADPNLPSPVPGQRVDREGALRTVGRSAAAASTPDQVYCFPDVHPDATPAARIFISTGGSTGTPRYARHDWNTLAAAARGFAGVFPGPAHSVCLLPLWHVGGLMQSVRARVASGRLKLANWDSVRSGRDRPDPNGYFISLVPTQLEHLMADHQARSWLKGFRAVLLGGGPTMPSLLERARSEGIPLAPAYGMTETAALVTVLRPTEFLAGRAGVGKPLPQVEIVVVGDDGSPVPAGRTGRIQVVSESLFYGYETEKGSALDLCSQTQRSRADPFLTGDLGYMDSEGFLTVVGRADDVIISGGEKVSPGEVEAAIRDAGLAREVVVFGLADERWGEVVCAVVSGGDFNDETSARSRLKSGLPVYKIPRRWRKVERLPRNRMGKLDRSRLAEMMEAT